MSALSSTMTMRTRSPSFLGASGGTLVASLGEGEVERRPLAHGAFGPDAAAVAAQDALNRGEPHAGALELLLGVETLESVEELIGVGGVEAGAVVAHMVDAIVAFALPAELDAGLRL